MAHQSVIIEDVAKAADVSRSLSQSVTARIELQEPSSSAGA